MHFDFGCTFHVRRDQHYVSSSRMEGASRFMAALASA